MENLQDLGVMLSVINATYEQLNETDKKLKKVKLPSSRLAIPQEADNNNNNEESLSRYNSNKVPGVKKKIKKYTVSSDYLRSLSVNRKLEETVSLSSSNNGQVFHGKIINGIPMKAPDVNIHKMEVSKDHLPHKVHTKENRFDRVYDIQHLTNYQKKEAVLVQEEAKQVPGSKNGFKHKVHLPTEKVVVLQPAGEDPLKRILTPVQGPPQFPGFSDLSSSWRKHKAPLTGGNELHVPKMRKVNSAPTKNGVITTTAWKEGYEKISKFIPPELHRTTSETNIHKEDGILRISEKPKRIQSFWAMNPDLVTRRRKPKSKGDVPVTEVFHKAREQRPNREEIKNYMHRRNYERKQEQRLKAEMKVQHEEDKKLRLFNLEQFRRKQRPLVPVPQGKTTIITAQPKTGPKAQNNIGESEQNANTGSELIIKQTKNVSHLYPFNPTFTEPGTFLSSESDVSYPSYSSSSQPFVATVNDIRSIQSSQSSPKEQSLPAATSNKVAEDNERLQEETSSTRVTRNGLEVSLFLQNKKTTRIQCEENLLKKLPTYYDHYSFSNVLKRNKFKSKPARMVFKAPEFEPISERSKSSETSLLQEVEDRKSSTTDQKEIPVMGSQNAFPNDNDLGEATYQSSFESEPISRTAASDIPVSLKSDSSLQMVEMSIKSSSTIPTTGNKSEISALNLPMEHNGYFSERHENSGSPEQLDTDYVSAPQSSSVKEISGEPKSNSASLFIKDSIETAIDDNLSSPNNHSDLSTELSESSKSAKEILNGYQTAASFEDVISSISPRTLSQGSISKVYSSLVNDSENVHGQTGESISNLGSVGSIKSEEIIGGTSTELPVLESGTILGREMSNSLSYLENLGRLEGLHGYWGFLANRSAAASIRSGQEGCQQLLEAIGSFSRVDQNYLNQLLIYNEALARRHQEAISRAVAQAVGDITAALTLPPPPVLSHQHSQTSPWKHSSKNVKPDNNVEKFVSKMSTLRETESKDSHKPDTKHSRTSHSASASVRVPRSRQPVPTDLSSFRESMPLLSNLSSIRESVPLLSNPSSIRESVPLLSNSSSIRESVPLLSNPSSIRESMPVLSNPSSIRESVPVLSNPSSIGESIPNEVASLTENVSVSSVGESIPSSVASTNSFSGSLRTEISGDQQSGILNNTQDPVSEELQTSIHESSVHTNSQISSIISDLGSVPTVSDHTNKEVTSEIEEEQLSHQSNLSSEGTLVEEDFQESGVSASPSLSTPPSTQVQSPVSNASKRTSLKSISGSHSPAESERASLGDGYAVNSDQSNTSSDVEGRVVALKYQLRRLKAETARLARENHRQELRNKEITLQKQVQKYSRCIDQLKRQLAAAQNQQVELGMSLSTSPSPTVENTRPKIRHSRIATAEEKEAKKSLLSKKSLERKVCSRRDSKHLHSLIGETSPSPSLSDEQVTQYMTSFERDSSVPTEVNHSASVSESRSKSKLADYSSARITSSLILTDRNEHTDSDRKTRSISDNSGDKIVVASSGVSEASMVSDYISTQYSQSEHEVPFPSQSSKADDDVDNSKENIESFQEISGSHSSLNEVQEEKDSNAEIAEENNVKAEGSEVKIQEDEEGESEAEVEDEVSKTGDEELELEDEVSIVEDEKLEVDDEVSKAEDEDLKEGDEGAEDEGAGAEDEELELEDDVSIAEDEELEVEDEVSKAEDEDLKVGDEEAGAEDEDLKVGDEEAGAEDEDLKVGDEEAAAEDEDLKVGDEEAGAEDEEIKVGDEGVGAEDEEPVEEEVEIEAEPQVDEEDDEYYGSSHSAKLSDFEEASSSHPSLDQISDRDEQTPSDKPSSHNTASVLLDNHSEHPEGEDVNEDLEVGLSERDGVETQNSSQKSSSINEISASSNDGASETFSHHLVLSNKHEPSNEEQDSANLNVINETENAENDPIADVLSEQLILSAEEDLGKNPVPNKTSETSDEDRFVKETNKSASSVSKHSDEEEKEVISDVPANDFQERTHSRSDTELNLLSSKGEEADKIHSPASHQKSPLLEAEDEDLLCQQDAELKSPLQDIVSKDVESNIQNSLLKNQGTTEPVPLVIAEAVGSIKDVPQQTIEHSESLSDVESIQSEVASVSSQKSETTSLPVCEVGFSRDPLDRIPDKNTLGLQVVGHIVDSEISLCLQLLKSKRQKLNSCIPLKNTASVTTTTTTTMGQPSSKFSQAEAVSESILSYLVLDTVNSLTRVYSQDAGSSTKVSEVSQKVNNILSCLQKDQKQSLAHSSKHRPQDLMMMSAGMEDMDWGPAEQQLLEQQTEPEWFEDDLGLPSSSAGQMTLVDQAASIASYYYYRAIPDKPPPPYTPPQGPMLERLVKMGHIPALWNLPQDKKQVDALLDSAAKLLYPVFSEDIHQVCKMEPSTEFLETGTKSDPATADNETSYKRFLFDLTKELVVNHYSIKKTLPSWKRQQKLYTPQPKMPCDVNKFSLQVQTLVNTTLKENTKLDQALSSFLRYQAKRHDTVDRILLLEMAQDEDSWIDYQDDEASVKCVLADAVFNHLVSDTVDQLQKPIYRQILERR